MFFFPQEYTTCGYRWVPGTGPKKIFGYRWVPGTGKKKNFGYRWVPGTEKIFTYADPCLREQTFFFKNFDFNNRCKNEIADNIEKSRSRFTDTVSEKVDFMIYGLQRGHPQAWDLKFWCISN